MTTKPCRHGRAWPTIFNLSDAGYLWCPDCGAVRTIQRGPGNSYAPIYTRWRVPGKWTAGDEGDGVYRVKVKERKR